MNTNTNTTNTNFAEFATRFASNAKANESIKMADSTELVHILSTMDEEEKKLFRENLKTEWIKVGNLERAFRNYFYECKQLGSLVIEYPRTVDELTARERKQIAPKVIKAVESNDYRPNHDASGKELLDFFMPTKSNEDAPTEDAPTEDAPTEDSNEELTVEEWVTVAKTHGFTLAMIKKAWQE